MYLSSRAPVIFEHDGAAVNGKLDGKFTSVANGGNLRRSHDTMQPSILSSA